MSQLLEITDIYNSYGFEYRKDLSEPNLLVFTITLGVFDNAIILSMIKEASTENLESELKDLGFQVKADYFVSLKQTEDSLFSGFFSVKKTKAGFRRDYNSHINNIIQSFPADGASYSYIKSPFVKNSYSFADDKDILEDI